MIMTTGNEILTYIINAKMSLFVCYTHASTAQAITVNICLHVVKDTKKDNDIG